MSNDKACTENFPFAGGRFFNNPQYEQPDQVEVIIARSMARKEMAFHNYWSINDMINPRPSFGWYVITSAVSMIDLMLVSALRTAFSLVLYLSPIEAVCSVLGIEGFIVTTGMKDCMWKNENELGTLRAIAVYILLIVSCVAGLFQNSALIGDPVTTTTLMVLGSVRRTRHQVRISDLPHDFYIKRFWEY